MAQGLRCCRPRSRGFKPAPWDEAKWRIAATKKRLRAKPFSIPQAAEEMAELCRRSGFEDVEVIELAKRKA